jgi:hypothetical protein
MQLTRASLLFIFDVDLFDISEFSLDETIVTRLLRLLAYYTVSKLSALQLSMFYFFQLQSLLYVPSTLLNLYYLYYD